MDPSSFRRASELPPYVFAEMAARKAEALARGRTVYDFSLGNPDGDPPPRVVRALEAAERSGAFRYPASNGSRELREAAARWYRRSYGVELDPESEVLPLLGSKEGIGHLLLASLGPGDAVLVPSPSYPIHLAGGRMAGAEVVPVAIGPGEPFAENARRAAGEARGRLRGLVACFPHNPTGVAAPDGELERLLALADERDLFFLHDLAYADLDFGRERAPSALALAGARARTVEFFSLSKSYNMAGFRVGFCCGNRDLVAAVARLKSYLDYGMFSPVQAAAIEALDRCGDFPGRLRELYRERARSLIEGLREAGWEAPMPGGTMFVWAPIPARLRRLGSWAFSRALFDGAGVAVSAGAGFGAPGEGPGGVVPGVAGGDGFVRFALVEDEARTREACRAIGRWLKDGA